LLLCDVNVLVYAHREDAKDHARYRSWLEAVLNGEEAFGVSDLILSGFVRVVTHPKVFARPTPRETAFAFVDTLRSQPNAIAIQPGARHWGIFSSLCESANAKGNLVPDAYLAAMAIESGCDWVTSDRDFLRFQGLRVRHPLA